MPMTYSYRTIISSGALIAGLIFYGVYHELVVVSIMPLRSMKTFSPNISMKKKVVKLIFWHEEAWHTEDVDVIWSDTNMVHNIHLIINRWLSVLDEEKVMDKKVTLQSVILSPSSREAFLSFDRNPLKFEDAAYVKLMWCEGLLKTIRDNGIPIESLRFLVHHAPLDDEHIDLAFSWPISGFLNTVAVPAQIPQSGSTSGTDEVARNFHLRSTTTPRPFTIMIDPAGDAKHAGRMLEDNFERGVTLQCANYLKGELERKYANVRVVLTRFPGETLEPLQNANFANRLQVDFYMSIHFYQDFENNPAIFLFRYVKHPTDRWAKTYVPLSLISYDQVHLIQNRLTDRWSSLMYESFKKTTQSGVKNLAIPFLPLKGIYAPALGIEVGLRHKNDWQHYISPCIQALGEIISADPGLKS